MEQNKKIQSALISVFDKEGLETIVRRLHELGITIYSTGGTYNYIKNIGIPAISVEEVTSYPSILGGRVKTLHPKIFGGILFRRGEAADTEEVKSWEIAPIDLVIVDLYPFEKTVAGTDAEHEIIEKIDIGGISLIRAAAKNFNDVLVVPSSAYYEDLLNLLREKEGYAGRNDRKTFAAKAFHVSSHYDTAIFHYFNKEAVIPSFKKSLVHAYPLRYGENPHQSGIFYGELEKFFEKLNGKEISFNNLVDLDAAIGLISDFREPAFAILKHTNPCGVACRHGLTDAWADALAGDPVSAYGGVLVTNCEVNEKVAIEIHKLFFEMLIAPGYEKKALELLSSRKNRILLQQMTNEIPGHRFKSVLNGVVVQDMDVRVETAKDLRVMTAKAPKQHEIPDLLFANIIVKHTKSNAIVLARNKQLLASGVGQTSRVDALKQAISKAQGFGFDLKGAVMASDAFFPFPDCVEIAHQSGITAVIQPGGSVKDADSIHYCDLHGMSMVFTGVRHFKH